jgi:hypothetical protein
MTPEEHRKRTSEATSVAMKAYWAQPGVKRDRKAAAKRRRRIRFLEGQITGRARHGITPTNNDHAARLQQELDQLRAEGRTT